MNVLFLAADDLSSWLLGDPHRYTGKVVAPNILGLAASGVNFTRESAAITGLSDRNKPAGAYLSIRNELGRYTRYADDAEEFYNTQEDPREWSNEIDNPEYAETIKKLRATLPDSSEVANPLPRTRRSR